MEADLFSAGKEVAIVRASIQLPIPNPLNMNRALRPYRSIVKKAINELKNFHVSAPPVNILVNWASNFKFSWKITGA